MGHYTPRGGPPMRRCPQPCLTVYAMTSEPGPIRVALVNDFEIVVRGLHAMLAPYPDRITVVELDSDTHPAVQADLALYDAFSMEGTQGGDLADLVRDPHIGRLVIYTWAADVADLRAEARSLGVAGVLSKSLPAAELVEALVALHSGECPPGGEDGTGVGGRDWPGKAEGLTEREAEVICLIMQGLSNQEIADRIYLSINSVKSYIRTAYRTMGVTTRSRAILWGLEHGLRTDRVRVLAPGTPAERVQDLPDH